ncbi:MAG: hypothetical protein U0031_11000 [Thermomicrobiales bacterium]
MSDGRKLATAVIGPIRRLTDALTPSKVHLAVRRREMRRGEAAPAAVEAHLAPVERQLDAAVSTSKEVKRAVMPTAAS